MSNAEGGKQPAPDGFNSWPVYWQAQGMEWRREPEIDEERQRFLAERRTIMLDIEKGIYPFRDENGSIRLTRADVEWLLATNKSHGVVGPVYWAQEVDKPKEQRRTGLDLRGANLRGVDLTRLPLTRTRGGLLRVERINRGPQQRSLAGVCFEGADLSHASLGHSNLAFARFEGANLYQATLTGATLNRAHFEAANLFEANLGGVKLRYAFFDNTSSLSGVRLTDPHEQLPRLYGVQWDGADLSEVDWRQLRILGEEAHAKKLPPGATRALRAGKRLLYYEEAVRAARQLSKALRDQEVDEDADRFAYQAQVLQRQVLRRQNRLGQWAFSLLLDVLAGYGYRLRRIVVAYVVTLIFFAAVFYGCNWLYTAGVLPGPPTDLTWYQALLVSLTAVHGRVFFEQFGLNSILSWVAAVESVCGIVIEGVFVAMLVQRFFGNR